MKRLHLSKDKKICGVCGGIAEYFDIDPSVIRLAWVIGTVLTGVFPGILAYIVACMVIPKHASESANAKSTTHALSAE